MVESLGGDTLEIEVSALKKTGLDKLLEAIALQAEVLELTANPDRAAEGVIVEAKLERGRGPVGTALIQRGTLHVGDLVVAGSAYGRVRALINELGEQVTSAGPSVPVEVLGFDSAPEAGDQFAVVENEARAREITDYRMRERRKRLAVAGARGSLEQMMTNLKAAGTKEFTLLVKGDVQGSVEAIVAALDKLGTDEVRARIVHAGVGGITESDVGLAATSGAVRARLQCARQRAGPRGRRARRRRDPLLRRDLRPGRRGEAGHVRHARAHAGRETFLGNAEILEVFTISKVGKVAGCRVTEGKVERGAQVRLIRDNVVVHEGKLSTLKRFKDEVREVTAGQECGMAFEGYQDMRQGDVIECFEVEHVQRTPVDPRSAGPGRHHFTRSTMIARDKGRVPAKGKEPSQRQLKVGETIRHALAEIFARGEIVDDVLSRHSLTVPEVRMTPDLKLATVYVFPLGGEGANEAVAHLDKHKRFLRGEVAKRISMKFMPELRFKVDTSFEASARIDELLASPKVARDLDS